MTINEVKRYLNEARHIKKQLLILEQAESNIIGDNINITSSYGKEHIDSNAINKPIEDAVLKLESIRSIIRNKKIEYSNILFERIEFIDRYISPSTLDNVILKERYINSKSWNLISKELIYNYKYLMRVHSRAIKKIAKNSN